jgi:NitT/TauT family transport system ATP-binding protein
MARFTQAISGTTQRFWQRIAAEWEGPAALQAGGHWHTPVVQTASRVAGESSVSKQALEQVNTAQIAPHSGANATPQEAAQPLLQVQDVSLIYSTAKQQVRATHRVSLDVFEGDRFVLLGASGCGKSSLLKALGGFIDPAEGQILLDGQPVHGPGPDRVVVFQEFDQLPPWKTVRENVMFPLLASGQLKREEARERADAVIAKVGLAQFADVHPHQLSGGMKQRVAIARALAGCAHTPPHARGVAGTVGRVSLHAGVCHPLDRRSAGGGQPHRHLVAAPRARAGRSQQPPV